VSNLWKLEQPAHGRGQRLFHRRHQSSGRRGSLEHRRILRLQLFLRSARRIFAQASRDTDEVLTADVDLELISEVRKTWQFFRDRRPDMYASLVKA